MLPIIYVFEDPSISLFQLPIVLDTFPVSVWYDFNIISNNLFAFSKLCSSNNGKLITCITIIFSL